MRDLALRLGTDVSRNAERKAMSQFCMVVNSDGVIVLAGVSAPSHRA